MRDYSEDREIPLLRLDWVEEVDRLVRWFEWSAVTLVVDALEREMRDRLEAYSLARDTPRGTVTALLTKEIKVWSSPVIVCAAAPQTCALLTGRPASHYDQDRLRLQPPGVLQVLAVPRLLHVLEKGSEAAESVSTMH